MTRRRFMAVPNGLTAIIAPDGFDPEAQDVNIYKIYSEYLSADKAYGYSFSDVYNTLTLSAGAGISYYYGYRRAGIDYTFTVNSVTNPFSAGDTKRFIIVNNTATSVSASFIRGSIWGVFGNKVTNFVVQNTNNFAKYIHFVGNTRLNSIPYGTDGVTSLIGNVTIPYTVTDMSGSFANCTGLNGVLTLNNKTCTFAYPFENTNLILVDSQGLNWEIYDKILYNDLTRTKLIGATVNKANNLTIPSGVTSINTNAFYFCASMTGVLNIPAGVTLIGSSAFYNCSSLTGDLNIPNTVTSLALQAFYGCSGLNGTLTIPNTFGNILPQSLFNGCSGLIGGLTIPSNITTLNNNVFYDCHSLTGNLNIPDTVTSMGTSVFAYCYGFTGSLHIPNTVTALNASIFYSCYGLTGTLTIPTSVVTIGNSAFASCSGFTGTLTIPNGVTTIGANSFQNCTGFDTINIPASITSITTASFIGMTATILNIASGYNPPVTVANYTFNFNNNLTADSLYQSIINITSGTKTVTIGTTNKNRLTSSYPNAVSDALARGITVV